MKILPVGAEVLHADRRTAMTKLIFAFRNFANAPKNVLNIKFVSGFSLQPLSETFLREKLRDMIINVYWSSHKVSVILVIFQ
jgi:hypothetical protein